MSSATWRRRSSLDLDLWKMRVASDEEEEEEEEEEGPVCEEAESVFGEEEEEEEWPVCEKEESISEEEESPVCGKEESISEEEEEEEEEEWPVYKEEESVLDEEEKEEEGPVYNEEDAVFGEEDEEKKEKEKPVCRLSHPAHPHTLTRRANRDMSYMVGYKKPSGICFAGSASEETRSGHMYYYRCATCDVEFHESCYQWPRKMTHPYHPQHPLTFSILDPKTGIIYDCDSHNTYREQFIGVGIPDPGKIFDNCTWCGGNLKLNNFFYRCSICNFCLDPHCSQTFPLPSIKNPRTHDHSLIFLPRPLSLPCDACGLVEKSEPSYTCLQCNFVVHKSCIGLPRIIKLTRHPHRLSYTPFLSPIISPCRLCYQPIDVKYGHYSCIHDDCSYVVHSKCATHKAIWDGRELEWKPEEFGETEDIAPFKKVGDDLIKYFCHEHHLNLEKYDDVRDADKQCEACTLHIDSRDFYNCNQCSFFLHEVCANLPRKLDHALHHHPLFLDPAPSKNYKSIACLVCSRGLAGFRYKCSTNFCDDGHPYNPRKFQVDVGCILVPDFFTHKSHEHPLFIPIPVGHDEKIWCEGCKARCAGFYLQCTLCYYVICYRCATIPDKLHNKYDAAHPLSLCYGEVSDETYWCEVCEKKLDPSEWFYTCNKTYITIHRKCVFGDSAYMKLGYTFRGKSLRVEVICNSCNTRPICQECHSRCFGFVYFKLSGEMVICSFGCLSHVSWRI